MGADKGKTPVPIGRKELCRIGVFSPPVVPPRMQKSGAVRSLGRSRFRREAPAEGGRKRGDRAWVRGKIDGVATLFHAWKSGRLRPAPADLRAPVFNAPQVRLVVFLLDVSDSMAETRRLARAWMVRFLDETYFRRDPVAVVTIQGNSADILVLPTTSLHYVLHRLGAIEEAGATPLARGIGMVAKLIQQWRDRYPVIDLFVLSDGRSTEPLEGPALERAVSLIRKFVRETAVVNPVPGAAPFARSLATLLNARYLDPRVFLDL